MVECPTTDLKSFGSNPGGAEIGLHVFHKQHNRHEYWLNHPGSKHRKRLSISSENLFRNRCKINRFNQIATITVALLPIPQDDLRRERSCVFFITGITFTC